jgi:hypothetical protein
MIRRVFRRSLRSKKRGNALCGDHVRPSVCNVVSVTNRFWYFYNIRYRTSFKSCGESENFVKIISVAIILKRCACVSVCTLRIYCTIWVKFGVRDLIGFVNVSARKTVVSCYYYCHHHHHHHHHNFCYSFNNINIILLCNNIGFMLYQYPIVI